MIWLQPTRRQYQHCQKLSALVTACRKLDCPHRTTLKLSGHETKDNHYDNYQYQHENTHHQKTSFARASNTRTHHLTPVIQPLANVTDPLTWDIYAISPWVQATSRKLPCLYPVFLIITGNASLSADIHLEIKKWTQLTDPMSCPCKLVANETSWGRNCQHARYKKT